MSAEQVQPGEQQLQDDVRQRTAVMKNFLNDLETNRPTRFAPTLELQARQPLIWAGLALSS